MINIAIILGSTRPGRAGEAVAQWVYEVASQRDDAQFDLIDLADYPLPHFDEALPPARGMYVNDHTKAWAAKIAQFDGYVFVTPEYNHGPPGVLKNAIDFLGKEWNNKAAGFVSYGVVGGARAVEQLRLAASGLKLATVTSQVMLSLFTDFKDMRMFALSAYQVAAVMSTLDDVVAWSTALAPLRSPDTTDMVA